MTDFDSILQNIREKIADHKTRLDRRTIYDSPEAPFLLSSEMEDPKILLSPEQVKNLAHEITRSIISRTGQESQRIALYTLIHETILHWNSIAK
ncbi:MAG: hypothetical protein JW812_02405 [Alphaproteobacteria bacterium]|nr:hypothetical protein [Alphaproteobacteria bacterium]MBN2780273.1 hypothetical protein [Alphaproteobacteria bacterium]